MQDIFERMQRIISEQFSVDEDEITMDTSFEEDLGADSVDLVELVMSMEEAFDIGEVQEDELSTLSTVGDCVNFLSGKLRTKDCPPSSTSFCCQLWLWTLVLTPQGNVSLASEVLCCEPPTGSGTVFALSCHTWASPVRFPGTWR